MWSLLFIFLTNLIVYLIKNKENFFSLCSIACKKRTDWIFRLFSFNNKKSFYLSLILILMLRVSLKEKSTKPF